MELRKLLTLLFGVDCHEIIHESFFFLGDDPKYHLECIFISSFHLLTEPVSFVGSWVLLVETPSPLLGCTAFV